MLDAADEPIAMLREKNLTMHKRWEAFRGESNASSNMIFSTKTENLVHFKTRTVSVMLANKSSSNDDCDLKIEGRWKKKNFTIGDSSKTIAQVSLVLTLVFYYRRVAANVFFFV
ncbi:putative tubby-like protein [Helianthus annuus]|nr:putative tubby-like protein [Helianthus annuus]